VRVDFYRKHTAVDRACEARSTSAPLQQIHSFVFAPALHTLVSTSHPSLGAIAHSIIKQAPTEASNQNLPFFNHFKTQTPTSRSHPPRTRHRVPLRPARNIQQSTLMLRRPSAAHCELNRTIQDDSKPSSRKVSPPRRGTLVKLRHPRNRLEAM